MDILAALLDSPGVYAGTVLDMTEPDAKRHPTSGRIVITVLPGRTAVSIDYDCLSPKTGRYHAEHSVLGRLPDGLVLLVAHPHGKTVLLLHESDPGHFTDRDGTSGFPVEQIIEVPESGRIVHHWRFGPPGGEIGDRDVADVRLVDAVLRHDEVLSQTEGSLRPAAFAFVVFGSTWGAWAVAAADVEASMGIHHGGLGLILSAGLLAAAVMNAVGGALVERHGSGAVLSFAVLGWGGLLIGVAGIHPRVLFAAALIAVLGLGGVVDVAMNIAATAGMADNPGGLVRFHSLFNFGAALGAGVTGVLVGNDLSWRWIWLATGVAAISVGLMTRGMKVPAGEPAEHVGFGSAFSLLRREGLLLVAAAFAVGALVEGGVDLWGVLYLRTTLPSGLLVGAGAAVAGHLVAGSARVLLGPVAGRRGPTRGVALGGGAAVVGILLLAFAPTAWLQGAGLVLAAGGISMSWPLLIALAGADRERPARVIGSVTSIGYLGLVIGPTVVGWLAATVGLKAGFVVLAGAACFVAIAPSIRSTKRA